jgi:hypothetical protein
MRRDDQSLAWGPLIFEIGFRSIARRHQGVRIRVMEGETQRLRFDCYDDAAHYHYDPDGRNQRHWRNPAIHPEPMEWALDMIGRSLPRMALAAGCVAEPPAPTAEFMDRLRALAESVDRARRQTLTHHPGDHLIPAGPVTFGLSYDVEGEGVSLRVLDRPNEDYEELLGIDCYRRDAHCHFGPRRKNAVIPLDPAVIDDPLEWVLAVLGSGRLPELLASAGYPAIGARVAESKDAAVALERDVGPLARRLQRDGRRRGTLP